MAKAVQARTLITRAKLLDAAQELVSKSNYESLRVEEIVLKAGVAKGTFFSHFKDKDALLDQLLGVEIDQCLDDLEQAPVPKTVEDISAALIPLMNCMSQERYVFDVVFRYSGAGAETEIGAIATTFGRQIQVLSAWAKSPDWAFRTDISADLVAEGMQAFIMQVIGLKFCALHSGMGPEERLAHYLRAWLK